MPVDAPRRTKIVATLGPASAGRIEELVAAGTNAIRLNLSHGTQEQHAEWAAAARAVEAELGRPLALIADLQGPKLRIGDLLSHPECEARGRAQILYRRPLLNRGDGQARFRSFGRDHSCQCIKNIF